MMKALRWKWIVVGIVLLWGYPAKRLPAGGALVVDSHGNPMVWNVNPIPYYYDRGKLGEHTNAEARDLTDRAFARWAAIPTSVLTFEAAGMLEENITEDNIAEIANTCNDLNEIIFDEDGAIIDEILGRGASFVVMGFAGPTCILTSSGRVFLAEGWAVLNGGFVDGKGRNGEVSFEEFESTFVHEFGHFIGLGHSQVNGLQYSNRIPIKGFEDAGLPSVEQVEIMYPIAIPNEIPRPPARDDVFAISWLYPTTGPEGFFETFGAIRGVVYRSDFQTFLQGVNLVARNVDDPLGDAVSYVSGDRFPSDGVNSAPPEFEGMYHFFGLTPGARYVIEAEEVCSFFTGGSGVGPLDPPLDLVPGSCSFLEWYGAPETGHPPTDDPEAREEVTVSAGAITDRIDIAINGEPLDCEDPDGDGVCSSEDRCPDDFDPAQRDSDGDGVADGCDPCPFDALDDGDGDGFCADEDNCPLDPNPDQRDTDGDGVGDLCACDNDEACPAERICEGGACVPEDCRIDADCEGDDICENRRCVPSECVNDFGCIEGEICEERRCVDGECQADGDCAEGKICERYRCVDAECATDADCTGVDVCEGGRCVLGECREDGDCAEGEICEGNRCTPGECTQDGDCAEGEICEGNRCMPGECTQDGDCAEGEICEGNRCAAAQSGCETDADCGENETCEGHECIPIDEPECTGDGDCPPDETCRSGKCVADPAATSGTETPGSSGCGCRTAPASGDPAPLLLLSMGFLLWCRLLRRLSRLTPPAGRRASPAPPARSPRARHGR